MESELGDAVSYGTTQLLCCNHKSPDGKFTCHLQPGHKGDHGNEEARAYWSDNGKLYVFEGRRVYHSDPFEDALLFAGRHRSSNGQSAQVRTQSPQRPKHRRRKR